MINFLASCVAFWFGFIFWCVLSILGVVTIILFYVLGRTATTQPKYGLIHFIFDLFMIGITGGLWFLYLILKAFRRLGR
jgi:hypothetical protein